VRRLIEFDRITVNLIDPETDTYSSAYVAGKTVKGWTKGIPEPITGKGVEAVSRTRSGIIVQGEGTEEFLKKYPRTQIGLECGLNSLLSVPVFWQGEVIGALALRAMAENAFSTGDMQVAERIAAQIAGSLANSALHATQKTYAREQATLAEISRVIDSSVRISEVYPRFASAVRKLIPFDRIAISTVDEDNGTAMARYVWGIDFPGSGFKVHRPMKGTATAAVTQARAGMIISPDDIMSELERFGYLKAGLEAGLNSTLAVPMMSRGRVVGSLMLRSVEVDAYSIRDLILAERVAMQISGAVRNVHLNEQLERSLLEQAQLAELGRGTIQARDLTSVFDQLIKVLKSCFEFDRIELGIHDPDRSSLHFDYVRGLPVAGMDEGYVLQRPSGSQLHVTWTDLMAAHCGSGFRDGLDGPVQIRAIQAAGLQSWLQFPLKSRDRVIGVISLRSKRQDAFVSSDLHFLERVAAQISPAIDNVRYYLQAQEDAQQRIAIEKIIRAIGQPGTRPELLASFRTQIADSIPADCVTVSATAPEFDEVASEFNSLRSGSDQIQPLIELANRNIATTIVESGNSLAIDCGLIDEHHIEMIPELADCLELAGFRASLSVPLLVAGVTVGVLHFHWRESGACSPGYRTLAEQAGILLINALGPFTASDAPVKTGFASPSNNQNLTSQIPTSVILIDSQGMCRQVIRAVVQSEEISIAAESYSLDDAMQLMQSTGVRLLLWEIHADEDVEMEVVSSILEAYPDAGVVIIDNGCGAGIIGEVMRFGVRGLLRKDTPPVRLVEALQAIARGETVFDPRILKSFFERFPVYHTGKSTDYSATMKLLGERDLAILQAVANGQSNAEIAAALSFAVGTIKNRLARIYKVLGVSDRAGAMAFAIRTGIVA
jgi:DNA-binding NarL/FixJ family response regulator/GAF domain-containing protein